MPLAIALIVAAGRGHRFGGSLPKQYCQLAGRAVLSHTLAAFAGHGRIDRVRAVIHPDDRGLYDAAAAGLDLMQPVAGGAERQESVRLGLQSLTDMPRWEEARVLIHDGARPFPTARTIDAVLDALEAHAGALPCLPVTDTLKRMRDARVAETVPRDDLYRAQTPQGFRLGPILAAHRAAVGRALTDDAAVAEAAGLAVVPVPGDADNIKVTTTHDLAAAERFLERGMETRIGQGYDVHRLEPGEGLWLCGHYLPHDRRLSGHSDADVGLHALVDAILGALGAGDIGQHFPPSDLQWRGAASARFLEHAAGLVAARGGRILNLDVTLICERPKIGPHRVAMRDRVAAIAGLDPARVSVKATTTERLGFAGRGEGIAAQAVAGLLLPASTPPCRRRVMFEEALVQRAARLLERCRRAGLMLATAESCTGGLIAALLTEVPGSSAIVERGFVAYSNAAKEELLGVEAAMLARHGAVSAEVAQAMAEGALARSTADLAVSVTGIAGPGGATPSKPVGLVYLGIARRGGEARSVKRIFAGNRRAVRQASLEEALNLLEKTASG